MLRCGPGCVARVLGARQIRSRHRWRTPHGGTSSWGPPGEGTAFPRQRPLGQHGVTRNPAYVAAATPSPPCIRTAPSFMRIALVRSGGGVRWVLRVSSGSSLSSNDHAVRHHRQIARSSAGWSWSIDRSYPVKVADDPTPRPRRPAIVLRLGCGPGGGAGRPGRRAFGRGR